MRLQIERRQSPVSTLLIVTDEHGVLRALDFDDYEDRMRRLLRDHYREYSIVDGYAPVALTRAIDAYFRGEIEALNDVKTETAGTPFQRDVWRGLRAIPAGTAISYGALALRIGRAGAARAVGAANGANPIAIVVPCHRVIGANGTLTGYGGGIERKQWLIEHERKSTQVTAQLPTARHSI